MRLKTYKMAMSILPKSLNLKGNISRTIWRTEVGDGLFFAFFTLFYLSLTFFRPDVPFKCRVWGRTATPGPLEVPSLKSPKDTIPTDEIVEENFEGSSILRLYQACLGSTKSTTLSVEEILVNKMDIIESYFDDESDSKDDE